MIIDPELAKMDLEQQIAMVAAAESSSTASDSSSSSSSASSASSVELNTIAKPPQDSGYDGSKLAAGPDEAIRHFPSRNPSPAIPTVAVVAAAPPAQPAHGPPDHIDPELEVDNAPPNVDIVVGDYELGDYSRFPSSSPTAVEDTSFDGERKRFSSLERENGRAYPDLHALFNRQDDDDDAKEVNDDSNIPVPNFDDTDESFVPRSNNTSNTSISINDKEEVKDDEPPAKRETRSKKKSLAADASVGDIVGTRTSSRIRASAGSQGGATRISEGHIFDSMKDFFELASPRLRENNHHMDIWVEEDFDDDVDLSLASASMDCANKKTPGIHCGCTVVAIQRVDEEVHDRMRGKKGYRPKLFWRITVYQPEHCVECIVNAASLSKEEVQRNEEHWLDRKAHYQGGNKVSTPSSDEIEDDEDEEKEDPRGRATSRATARKSASGRDRKKARPASARRESSKHHSTIRAPSREENGEGGSDMDMSNNEDDNGSGAESDASDDVITVSASFNGPRLSQVKKEGTPYAQSARSSSSQPRAKVYRETVPLGPIPGHEHRNSASKNKNKTSTKAVYGTISSAPSSSSKQTKMKPPPSVLRDRTKQGVRDQRSKSASTATVTRSASSSTIGLRKRTHEESETTDTPEPPEEQPYQMLPFPRHESNDIMSPGPLSLPHLSQAPRLSASPAKRFKSNRASSSPKRKFSAETPISSFKILPIALEVLEAAEVKTLGDFLENGTSSRDLLGWFLTYYCYAKFGMDACSGSKDGDARGELVKGAAMMQLMAANRVLGPALDQLEQEEED